jgi:hypothetical protein
MISKWDTMEISRFVSSGDSIDLSEFTQKGSRSVDMM